MRNAETVAGVHTHTHTRNLLKNKEAKKLALLSIYKASTKHENVKSACCFCA